MEPDVPLVIAEVNPEHLGVARRAATSARLARRHRRERQLRGDRGGAAARADPSRRSASARSSSTTMQAVSGAGYPGVPSLDILGNVIPYIERRGAEDRSRDRRSSSARSTGTRRPERAISPSARTPIACRSSTDTRSACRSALRDDGQRGGGRSRDRRVAAARDGRADCRARRSGRSGRRATSPIGRSRGDRSMRGGGMTVAVGRVRPDPMLRREARRDGAQRRFAAPPAASVLNAELMVRCGLLGALVIVLKFGGTSVGDAAAIDRAAAHRAHARRSRSPIVVVSALAGVTNALLALAEQAAKGQLHRRARAHRRSCASATCARRRAARDGG